jgi:pimeloyl-ACP methyl ester carboxylesterase
VPYAQLDDVRLFFTDEGTADDGTADDARSKAVSWEGVGHWLHQERPDEFNTVVEQRLASLPAPTGSGSRRRGSAE